MAFPPAPLFIGVDGGGTGCRVRIRDIDDRLLGEAQGGPGNARLGPSAFAEVLTTCRTALAAAGLAESDLGRAHAGLGLAGTAQAADRAFVLAQEHPFASMTVETDAYTAWLGAHRGQDGAILIIGTGSCGLAVVEGKRYNVGGWSADISDEGSGMAIGKDAIRRSIWALEGMAPLTPLADAILDEFERNPETVVAWAAQARPGDFARFAPLVLNRARDGDALALQVLEPAVGDIVRMIRRLVELGAPKIAPVGGLSGPIGEWLPPEVRAHLVPPQADAAEGAILMARRTISGESPS